MTRLPTDRNRWAPFLLVLGVGPLIAPLIAPLAGCSPTHPQQRLVVASKNRIDSIDPAAAYSVGALQVLSGLGDTLYRIDGRGALHPSLAVGWPQLSADGLRARVRLRRDVRFHDGTPFDAAAMAFSLERFLAIGKLSYLLGDRVASVRAVEPHTLELTLKRPYSPLAQLLSAINLTPLSPQAYRQIGRAHV